MQIQQTSFLIFNAEDAEDAKMRGERSLDSDSAFLGVLCVLRVREAVANGLIFHRHSRTDSLACRRVV